jgi:hypothetical protein
MTSEGISVRIQQCLRLVGGDYVCDCPFGDLSGLAVLDKKDLLVGRTQYSMAQLAVQKLSCLVFIVGAKKVGSLNCLKKMAQAPAPKPTHDTPLDHTPTIEMLHNATLMYKALAQTHQRETRKSITGNRPYASDIKLHP